GGADEIGQGVVEQRELGAGGADGDLQQAVVGEFAGAEVLDQVAGAGGDDQLTVDDEAAAGEAGRHGAAVDDGVLQLEHGVGGGADAVLVAVDLDGAGGGADEIGQGVVEQRELGAGGADGDLQQAVVGEFAGAEVLDQVAGAGGDDQLTVDDEAAAGEAGRHGAAVDDGVLQLEHGVGGGDDAVLVAVDLDGAGGGADEIGQGVVEQRELGAGGADGDLQQAVVGEFAVAEVLDQVAGAGGDDQLTVDVEAAAGEAGRHGAAVDDGVLQLEHGVGGGDDAVLVAVDLDGAG